MNMHPRKANDIYDGGQSLLYVLEVLTTSKKDHESAWDLRGNA